MTVSQEPVAETVRLIVDKQLNLSAHGYEFGADDDLWALGMTSLTCMGLMLAVEDTFRIELPEEALKEGTFRTVGTITAAVEAARPASGTKV
ncbi:phosphopantetheine-binding protein [Microtetraspora niveoalba]|uniref:phosphopantetheine-binding protein n=1 Tax=Microtetraspora niveoalba TaxID=46175 RepID=UPI00082C9043|nr:phosphopantetheine-binding protein [Microtetraspora niveoalba]